MELDGLFEKYLKEEERILWVGQPKQGIQIRDADMILIPMSIILIGFSIILNYTLFHYEASILFYMVGVILAASAIYMGIIRFFADSAKRSHTYYCITSKRVIVLRGKKKPVIKTLPFKNIERMDTTDEKDGSGFIIFGATNPLYPWLLGGFYFTAESVPGLELLPDVNFVYNLITSQIKISISPALAAEIKQAEKKDLN